MSNKIKANDIETILENFSKKNKIQKQVVQESVQLKESGYNYDLDGNITINENDYKQYLIDININNK
jgi:hypothetical protein